MHAKGRAAWMLKQYLLHFHSADGRKRVNCRDHCKFRSEGVCLVQKAGQCLANMRSSIMKWILSEKSLTFLMNLEYCSCFSKSLDSRSSDNCRQFADKKNRLCWKSHASCMSAFDSPTFLYKVTLQFHEYIFDELNVKFTNRLTKIPENKQHFS